MTKVYKIIMVLVATSFSIVGFADDNSQKKMTVKKMQAIVKSGAKDVKLKPGVIEFKIDDRQLLCIYDVKHDRMRLISPIVELSKMDQQQTDRVLEANFHTALDARYASRRGILYSAYIHPLSSLSRLELEQAMKQVATLANTYGTGYTSGALVFAGGK